MLLFNEIINIFNNNSVMIELVGIAFLLDFITGISKAIYQKNVKSNKLKKSAGKFIIYFVLIFVGIILTIITKLNITINNNEYPVFIYLICLYLIITECISINENGKIFFKGIPFINNYLKQKKEELDNTKINDK